ncbi:MAG: hypothetical protein K6347_06860 [Campylobacterales bacterium]
MISHDEAIEHIQRFFDKFFQPVYKVIDFEETFIREWGLVSSRVDYIKLKRFIVTAIRNLADLDERLVTGLLAKLKDDVFSLFEFHAKFLQLTQVSKIIFERDFLGQLQPYRDLIAQFEKTKALRDNYQGRMRQMENQLASLEGATTPEKKLEY